MVGVSPKPPEAAGAKVAEAAPGRFAFKSTQHPRLGGWENLQLLHRVISTLIGIPVGVTELISL